jgi:catechol 2,3-dioxygenase-like lactoylglutathione lyase family enzyme
MLMSVKFAVVCLRAPDPNALAPFYAEVLGLPPAAVSQEYPHFDLGGSYLVLRPGTPDQANAVHDRFPAVALAVDDLHAALHRLQAHAVELPWGVESNPRAQWVVFWDPAGNLIELVQFGAPQHTDPAS